MNASEIRAKFEWGWERYERTHWMREDGRKLFVGHFMAIDAPNGFSHCEVCFWAKHPQLAMRDICRSQRDPMDFAEKVVN